MLKRTYNITKNILSQIQKIKTLSKIKPTTQINFAHFQATAGFFKHGKAKDEAGREEGTKLILESFDALVNFLNDLKKPFIGGESPGFNDYMFWPFMQRIALRHKKLVDKNATVKSYCEKMVGDESVKACRHPDSLENRFWDGYFHTGKPEYNIY